MFHDACSNTLHVDSWSIILFGLAAGVLNAIFTEDCPRKARDFKHRFVKVVRASWLIKQRNCLQLALREFGLLIENLSCDLQNLVIELVGLWLVA